MKKRFYAASELGYVTVFIFGLCGIGYLLLSWSAETLGGLWGYFIFYYILLSIFWIAVTKGTHITVDDREIKGTVLYIFGGKTKISSIISLKKTASFAGLITQIYMMCQSEKGSISERGLTSVEMLKKEDLKELIETIRTINPNIDIPSDLLHK